MRYIKGVCIILFLLFVVVIAVQNYEAMSHKVQFRIDLLFFNHVTPPMSLYLVSIISFLIGVFFTALFGIAERFRLKREIRRLKKEAEEKDKELNSLRNLPVTSDDVGALEPAEGQ